MQALRNSGLRIVESKAVVYGEELVEILYDHMDSQARKCITDRYRGRIGVALCIEDGDIETCMTIIGRESDPQACAPESIRTRFGESGEPERIGGWLWWENALHRPVDERERLRDLQHIFPERTESAG